MPRRSFTLFVLVTLFAFGLPSGPLSPVILSSSGQQALAAWQSGANTLISEPNDPAPETELANGGSSASNGGYSITPDGSYVAFTSAATNLVSSTDSNQAADIFIYDTHSRTISRIIHGPTGMSSSNPSISADGRWIAFLSDGALLAEDENPGADVYLFDRATQGLELASSTDDEDPPDGAIGGGRPAISADGRFVAFESSATNHVAGQGDVLGHQDIFRYDRTTGDIVRVSLLSNEAEPNGRSDAPSISADGSIVAFQSAATNLDEGGSFNDDDDVFIRDVEGTTTSHVSTTATGGLTQWPSRTPSISADGMLVAYVSDAPNLVSGDTSTNSDIFVKEPATDEIWWASATPNGTSSSGASSSPALSSTGQYVTYASSSVDLVAGDSNGKRDIFIHDLDTGGTDLASQSYTNGPAYGAHAARPGVSEGGSLVVFDSVSNDHIPGDTNNKQDVFIRDLGNEFESIALGQARVCGWGFDAQGAECMGDPVNSLTGAFVSEVMDLSLPGIGLPFAFRRTYASDLESEGSLGQGWTHSFEASLGFEWDGDAVLRNEVGQTLHFTERADGTFKPDSGVRSLLAVQGTGHVLTRRDQTELTFDAQGRLSVIADRNANALTLTYSGGELDSVEDTVGRVIDFTFSPSGRLSTISTPDGRNVSFGYTTGLLTSVIDVRGETTTYAYGGADRLTEIVDQNDQTEIANTYGASGRVVSQIDAMGETTTFSWNRRLHTTTMTDARGELWKDKYRNNLLVRKTDPLGNVTKFTYDDDANVASVTDPRNNTTTMTYGARGNLLTRTAPTPLSYQEVWTYNANNDPLTYEDGRDNTTSFGYDTAGNLSSVTQPGSVVTSFGRDPATGQLTSVTDPRNKTTEFTYDALGNLDEVETPLGNLTTFGQDSAGRLTSMVEPRGNVSGADPDDYRWLFTYDAAGSLRTRQDPLGNVTEWTYDPAGNVDTVEDANGHVIDYGYNAANELIAVTAPGQITTNYGYDDSGNLVSRTDDNMHTTDYEYDDAGRLSAVEDPLGNRWTYSYDAAGNLQTATDAEGNFTSTPGDGMTTFSYDQLNRTSGVNYSGSTPDATWTYDGNSNPTQITDGAGTETYGYDALNRPDPVTRGSAVFDYQYDAAGNVTRRTYPDGTVVDLTYDDDGRLDTVTSDGEITTYGYDAAGNLTSVDYADGTEENRVYDRAGRLTEVAHTEGSEILASFDYTLDPVGNPTRVDSPAETITYDYDDLHRLTEACYQVACTTSTDPFIRYTYDGVGNRLTEARPEGTTTYAYNAADRLTGTSGLSAASFTYDRNGNQTSAGGRSFTWNQQGLLASTTDGTQTTTYAYDGWGKRLSATEGSDVTTYTWDVARPLPELVAERDGSGGLKRRYLYGRDLLQMTTGGSDYTYHHDALGSVVTITDEAGEQVVSYLYEPFGTERPVVPANPTTPENPMRFAGEYLDTSGLYHLRARQYDSSTGGFLSLDPLATSANQPFVSPYAYVNGRPTTLVDPSGLRGHSIGDMPWWEDLLRNPVAVWQDGFAITPTWVKIADGILILLSGGLVICYASGLSACVAAGSSVIGGSTRIDPNKLHHIFGNPKHNLGSLVQRLGSEERAYRAIERATRAAARSQGLSGVFKVTVKVRGINVTVSGAVVNGMVRIGTARA